MDEGTFWHVNDLIIFKGFAMTLGSYKVPPELNDETKILKLFSRKQFFLIAGFVIAGFVLMVLFIALNLFPIGLLLFLLISAIGLLLVMTKVPEHLYLIGCGNTFFTVVVRILRKKKKKNRVIYTKNYNN